MLLEEKVKISELSEFSIFGIGNCFFTSNFGSSCNLRCKHDKKSTETRTKVQDMLLEEKVKIFELSEFSILTYTQN